MGATATFTASATGSPTPTAQWQSAPAGGTFTDIQNATGTSYTTPATVAADNGRQYRVVFSNSEGTATSSAATLTVVQAPTANAQTVAVTFDTATAITLSGTDPNTPPRPLTYTVATQPSHGGLSGTAPNLTYTPNQGYAGPDSFTFTASNGIATSAPATVSITVGQGSQTITFTSQAPTAARARGTSYTVTATATSGQPVTFASATAGVCTVSGSTVEFVGAGTCTITANQAGNASHTAAPEATQSFTVAAATITFSPPAGRLPGGTVGVAYSVIFTASGGNGPYTYAVTAGALPPGMTLDQSTGRFSGRPTGSGQASFTITATDSTPAASGGSFTGSAAYTVNIQAPTIVVAPNAVPAATAGTAYSQQLTASGGTAPYTFTTAGPLPRGLTLSPGGLLSGTPAESGTFVFNVRAIDSSTGGSEAGGGYAGTRSYTLDVGAPTIALAPPTLPNPQAGAAYSQALTASGGSGSYTFAITAGALPRGITLSAQGVLSGTPTEGGIRQFTVTATDGNGFTGARTYQVTVQPAAIAIAPDTLPDATARVAYSQTLTATGGTAPYTFQLVSGRGTPPAGVTLQSNGTLSGSPTQVGSFTFDVRVVDSSTGTGPFTSTRTYTLNVGVPAIVLAPASLPQATTRVAYTQTVTASGGNAPYRFTVTAGAIPAGLALGADGTFQGAPTTAGTFNLTITATDADGNAGSRGYTLTVAAPAITLAPDALPQATTRVAYTQTLTATGGTGPYSFAVTGGALPNGLTLATSGTFQGAATVAGTFNFTATATDANGNAGIRQYTLTVGAPTITLAPDALPAATTRVAYTQTLSATGGTGPYGYAVTGGALPTGLTLASSGTFQGAATAAGDFAFTVTATDANGNSGSRAYTLTVTVPAIALAPAALPDATTRVAYSQALSVTGGTGPYSFAVTAGALPSGITLSAGGTLAGTATAAGNSAFTVTVTDANGNSAARAYTLTVVAPAIALSQATLADATVGAPYAASLTATGGAAPYRFTATGALPAGVTLSEAGALSGTPTAGGSFAFTATATDANGNAASRDYTLVVQAAAVALAPATLADAQQGVAYTATVSATGGTAPYSFAVTAGRLPAGVTLSAQGALSGTPTENGRFPVSITATDSSGGSGPFSATRAYTLVVGAPAVPSAGAVSLTVAYGAAATPVPLSLSGGTATRVAVATAPQRGTAAVTGLAITYAPAPGFAGTDTFTYTASNDGGTSAPATVTVTVTAPSVALTPASLAGAQQDVAYQATLSATGGTAPYRFQLSAGRLPAGLTLSGATIAGTPTESGSFAFSVTATDASTGSGPFSATRAYTLAVALPTAPVAQDSPTRNVAATPLGGRSTIDIDLSALVSGNVSDIRIATSPRNGTVAVAQVGGRFVATYSPNVDYRGADAFAFTATGPGGSATATVALNVTGVAPVAPALRATVESGQVAEVVVTAAAGGGPFTGAAVVSTSPADAVTATVVETSAGGVRQFALRIAAVGRFSGAATVTYTLTNAFGTSTPAVIGVTVTARPDPAQNAEVTAMATAQSEAARRFAQTQIDNFARRTEMLHNGGAGSTKSPMGVQFGADLGIRPGNSGSIPGNQEPMSDVLAMKMEHATGVRGAERASGLLGVGADGRLAPVAGGNVGGLGGRARAVAAGGLAGTGAGMPAGALAAGQTNPTDAAEAADDGTRRVGSTAIWSGGAVTIGMRDETSRRNKLRISSGGLSAGADLKVDEALTIGVGGGYGADRTRIGRGDASRVDSESWMGAAYGSFQPAPNAFIDAVIGGGGLRFDSIRDVANGATARGRRDGSMWFGSLSAGIDRTTDSWRLSAYGRADYLSADLDAYTETGGGTANLRFAQRDLTSLSGLIGVRGSFVSGRWVPRLRAEYRHEFKRSGAQALDYADLSGFGFSISDDRWLRDALSAELGTDYMLGDGWQLGLDLGGAYGSSTVFGTGKLSIRKQF